MATTKKTSETKKEAPKRKEASKKAPAKAEAKTEVKPEVKAEVKPEVTTETKPEAKEAEAPKAESSKGNGQTIAIVILSAVLLFAVLVFTVLSITGVIKFGGGDNAPVAEKSDTKDEKDDDDDDHKYDGRDSDDEPIDDDVDYSPQKGDIISNPNKQVKENNATLVHVGELEIYLPRQFKYGGKNKDGALTYNLEDDDGWASVSVYSENTSLSPARYIKNISSYLEVTDTNYRVSGTSWVKAETASTVAYATKLKNKVYAVYYAIKLDSDATDKATSMIPKTLYMKEVIKD